MSHGHLGQHKPRAGRAQGRRRCVLYAQAMGGLLGEVFSRWAWVPGWIKGLCEARFSSTGAAGLGCLLPAQSQSGSCVWCRRWSYLTERAPDQPCLHQASALSIHKGSHRPPFRNPKSICFLARVWEVYIDTLLVSHPLSLMNKGSQSYKTM